MCVGSFPRGQFTQSSRVSRALLMLAIVISIRVPDAVAQTDKYPSMAPIAEYQMEAGAEIQLARSAAPSSISRHATIMVLGAQGYETAVQGTNGFVCMVARSWLAAFDWPEFWNPKIRAADCMNAQAARTILPIVMLRGSMVMAGHSRAEILSALRAAFAGGQVPALEAGAMSYMMSPTAYLTDEGDHNAPHVMFLTVGLDAKDWGAGDAGSPFMSAPYWFFSANEPAQMTGLPEIHVFLMGAPNWSDGSPAHP